MAAGAAWATWRRASAIASPGTPLAISVVPLLTGWALTRPFNERLPVFPYGSQGSGDWGASLAGWTCLGVAAVAILLAALADAPWWTLRCRDAGRLGEVDLDPMPRAGTGSPRGPGADR